GVRRRGSRSLSMSSLASSPLAGRALGKAAPALAALLLVGAPFAGAQTPKAADIEFFENSIRPLLAQRCYSCHGADKQFGGLRTDSAAGLLKGGKSGAAIAPGKPDQSLLMRAVRGESLRMPLGGQLSDGEIAALGEWIQR